MNYLESLITESQNRRIKEGTLTGSHIIVHQNNSCIINKVFGKKSANGEKLTTNNLYRIASMTKPITAVALLIEHDKGRINIFDDVSDYIPEFKDMYVKLSDGSLIKAEKSIKLYMLVSHVSGINSFALEGKNNPMPMSTRTLKSVSEYTAKQPLSFEPLTSQEYNTIAYDVAARIVEITSGMNFQEYLKINLFDKLEMKDTTFVPDEKQWNRMVSIHDMKDGKPVDAIVETGTIIDGYPLSYYAAGCALISSAEDYCRFAEMLLNRGKNKDGFSVISPESVKLMTTPVVDDVIMPGSQKWGLGVRVITDNDYFLPNGSFGWSGKYGSHFWVDPSNNLVAVYMKNSSFDGGAGCMTGIEFEKDVMKYLNSI